MSARTWSPLLFPYNWQLSELRNFTLMYYTTCIITIQCKFKYSTHTTLNVNSARVKLNKYHNWMFSKTHSTPMRTCSSSLLVTIHGVSNYNLCNWPVILSSAGLHSDVSHFTILSGKDVDDSTSVPVSTNCTRSLDYYKVVYLHISFFCIPFLSWN